LQVVELVHSKISLPPLMLEQMRYLQQVSFTLEFTESGMLSDIWVSTIIRCAPLLLDKAE
jgi:hypothetical protein